MPAIQDYLSAYRQDHRHPANRRLHWLCIPLIAWSVVAGLWTVPVPAFLGRPGLWAVAMLVLVFAWYWKHSRRLGAAMLAFMVIVALSCEGLFRLLGGVGLLELAGSVFVLAWLGQFIGHHLEGRRPSFFTDLTYLLIGPVALMDQLLRRLGSVEKPQGTP